MKKREKNIDAIRGAAILLVVMGHSIQYSEVDFDNNIFFRIIYSFHMPLFMFISGYVSSYSKGTIYSALKSKTMMLALPFFTWAVVNFVKSVFEHTYKWQEIGAFFLNLIHSPDDNGLWFLWVLFLINLIVLLLRFTKINLQLGLFGAWVLLNLIFARWNHINLLGLSLLKYHLFYFLLGLIYCNAKDRLEKLNSLILVFCTFFFPFIVLFWYRLSPPQFIANLNFGALPTKILWLLYQYISGILGIGTSFLIVNLLCKWKSSIMDYLSTIGLITLEIYAVHFYPLSIGLSIINLSNNFFGVVVVFSFTLVVTILIVRIMKKSGIISLLFFGQKKTYYARG